MKKNLFRAALVVVWLAIFARLASSAAQIPRLDFIESQLDNGLRVIIAPDHSAPVFAIAVTYNVGSRNERPGRTGFAHLFEHMMFQGSENVGKGEHFILIFNNGGGMNGTTNEDRTNYFQVLPKNQLDLALFLESDRMRSLAVNQINLDNQRRTVQEERRLGIDNQPYGKAMLEIDNLGYDNFAYKHSVIGSMADLEAATLEDVKEFFRIYYAPNNAVLTLVGDLETGPTLEKIKKYFGSIPSQPKPPPVDLTEPGRIGERRTTIFDPLARLPQVILAYQIPPGDTPDNYALRLLADVLGAGQSSRLYQRVIKEKQLAASVRVQAESRIGPSSLYVMAVLRPGAQPEEFEKAVYEEIEAVQRNGITDKELEKARAQERRGLIQSRQSSLTTAIRLGEYAVKFNHPELINTMLDELAAVTADQIKEAATKYLTATSRTVVTTLPKAKAVTSAGANRGGVQ
jgi:predicted Zn-dependent peptidase